MSLDDETQLTMWKIRQQNKQKKKNVRDGLEEEMMR